MFPSLSGIEVGPLGPAFRSVQDRVIGGRGQLLQESWDRLIHDLEKEVHDIRTYGNSVIPQIDHKDLVVDSHGDVSFPPEVQDEIRKRGVAIIRNVIPRDEARQYKSDLEEYIAKNPDAHGFPKDNPTVFELYWSKQQVRARSHSNMIAAQKALLKLWRSTAPHPQPISVRHPLTYADRLRIRQPGDAKFMLGPHMDQGSVERWEDPEYSNVYKKILYEGKWEDYDPFDYHHRLEANSDLHDGQGQCTMYRMFQGWLSMSDTGPTEGTLRVNPLIKHATSYVMLRPFFAPESALGKLGDGNYDPNDNNTSVPWNFTGGTSVFPNSMPGCGQELSPLTHPHLALEDTMVSLPRMHPGDFVAWHCDTIHAVESQHRGKGDSSVLYIPACPMTEHNLQYLVKQRDAFLRGTPAPDFPDANGPGESKFDGRGTEKDFASAEGAQSMGLGSKFDIADAVSDSERIIIDKANSLLFN